jgi:hypothetical protein
MASRTTAFFGALFVAASLAACTLIGEAELDDKDEGDVASGTAASTGGNGVGAAGGGGAATGSGGDVSGGAGGMIPCEPVSCDPGAYCDHGRCICGSPFPEGLPAGSTCPTVCTSCDPNLSRCTIECATTDACKNATIVCPDGMECDVRCLGDHSCESATVQCPETYACEVGCKNDVACKNANIVGNTGSLTLTCIADFVEVCRDTLLSCGQGQCLHPGCAFVDGPIVSCNASCDCEAC